MAADLAEAHARLNTYADTEVANAGASSSSSDDDDDAETDAAPRTYLWARHGEAEHNASFRGGDKEAGRRILDPRLTAKGESQAADLRDALRARPRIGHIVTTPLSRALLTAVIVAEGSRGPVTIHVTPLLTETGVVLPSNTKAGRPCQRGRSLAELQREYGRRAPGNVTIDWGLVTDETWAGTERKGYAHPERAEKRLGRAKAWLRESFSAEARVLVVGHSGVFDRLLGVPMRNGELVEMAPKAKVGKRSRGRR